MKRHRELDHAQPGTEMAAGDRDRVDGFPAQLVGKLAQPGRLELTQVRGRADAVEKGSVRILRHE